MTKLLDIDQCKEPRWRSLCPSGRQPAARDEKAEVLYDRCNRAARQAFKEVAECRCLGDGCRCNDHAGGPCGRVSRKGLVQGDVRLPSCPKRNIVRFRL